MFYSSLVSFTEERAVFTRYLAQWSLKIIYILHGCRLSDTYFCSTLLKPKNVLHSATIAFLSTTLHMSKLCFDGAGKNRIFWELSIFQLVEEMTFSCTFSLRQCSGFLKHLLRQCFLPGLLFVFIWRQCRRNRPLCVLYHCYLPDWHGRLLPSSMIVTERCPYLDVTLI